MNYLKLLYSHLTFVSMFSVSPRPIYPELQPSLYWFLDMPVVRVTVCSAHESEVKSLSPVQLFATPWTNVAHQALPSMGFSRQEYWSGFLLPSPGDLPYPGIEGRSPALQADALTSEPPGKPQRRFQIQ